MLNIFAAWSTVQSGTAKCVHCGESIAPGAHGFVPWGESDVIHTACADARRTLELERERRERWLDRQRIRAERSELARARWRATHPAEPPDPRQLDLYGKTQP